jgi:NitT/TauT family transport system ATP-binding protein
MSVILTAPDLVNSTMADATLANSTVGMPKLAVDRVCKYFRQPNGDEFYALTDVSLIGHSGCGKSTLLNIVAGLDEANAGSVKVDGIVREGPGADRGMVFQSYTLFPWLSIRDNVTFGLRMAGMPKAERNQLAMHYLSLVKLENFADYYPKQLSGGMRQRVALARALANKPAVLLMDEPFGALDAETREQMHDLLIDVRAKEHMTVLFITHDMDEAIFLSERIGIMAARPGRITQELDIGLPANRTSDTKLSNEFLNIKRDVINRFKSCKEIQHAHA